MRALGYARCSTNEKKQDVEVQLKELRRYCEAYGWAYDEVWEYGSGYKADKQPKLDEALEQIRLKHYDVLIVFSIDRFSRQSPSKINSLMDKIVEQYKCRFIAMQQGIDSNNEMTWHAIRPIFTYFANKFSKDLGEKIKLGIERKKEKGVYGGGRPSKVAEVDCNEIVALRAAGMSLRAIAEKVSGVGKRRISFSTVRRCFKNIDDNSCVNDGSKGVSR